MLHMHQTELFHILLTEEVCVCLSEGVVSVLLNAAIFFFSDVEGGTLYDEFKS